MKILSGKWGVFAIPLLFQLGATTAASAQSLPGETKTVINVPDHVIYELYFRRMVYFDDLADKMEKEGPSGDAARSVIKSELGLNDTQRRVLGQIGSQALEAAASLDAKANAIIQRDRARYPDGKVLRKEDIPPFPKELAELQTLRNAVFVNVKAQLADALGSAAFQAMDAKITSIVKQRVTAASNR